jgi:hypothetical protein
MNDMNFPETDGPSIGEVEPGAAAAIRSTAPVEDQATAEADLQEIMATGERLPVGMSDLDALTEQEEMLAGDFDGRTVSDQEEE